VRNMIKAVIAVVAGAVGALEGERLAAELWDRVRPSKITDSLLEKANRRLESQGETTPPSR
jgi:hypothetical protein